MDAIRGNSVRDLGDSVPEPFLNKYLVALAQIQVQSNWRNPNLGLGRTLQPLAWSDSDIAHVLHAEEGIF